MENLPNINEVLDNKYFQVGMIVWVVFFSGCITSMVPDNVRRLLDNSAVRVAVLALVVYLADKDFKLAIVVAAGFFLSTAPLDVKEGMACPDGSNPDSKAMNAASCSALECNDQICEGAGLTGGYCTTNQNKICSNAECKDDCNGTNGDSTKCYWDSTANNNNGSCVKTCSVFNDTECNANDRCEWNSATDTCATKTN